MMLPHVGVSDAQPEEAQDSRKIAPQMNVPWTISGASVLGKTPPKNLASVGAPTDIAASTYGSSSSTAR